MAKYDPREYAIDLSALDEYADRIQRRLVDLERRVGRMAYRYEALLVARNSEEVQEALRGVIEQEEDDSDS